MEKSGVRAQWLQQEVTSDHRWSLKQHNVSCELRAEHCDHHSEGDSRYEQAS